MMLAVNQPYFFPFPGFFYKAHLSDVFVILDSVQFPRGTTWITRNRFKNNQGTLWMTVPVKKKGLGLQNINDVRICDHDRWGKKHLQSIKSAYSKAPYYKDHMPFVENLYASKFESLIDLNLAIIRYLSKRLQIHTPMKLLSELHIHARGDHLLVEICKTLGASTLLTQSAATKYLDEDVFTAEGISLKAFKPLPLIYPQLWGDFIPNLSTLDLMFNCGPKAHEMVTAK
ncbi:MAG: WbqC family protein [Desulfobacterales bacterium]|nr:MAG: WbqC family protein [Desulfobacterales bacterium]